MQIGKEWRNKMNSKDKIYRRATQLGNTPKKKKDEKARLRNRIFNMRVTPREYELIQNRIEMFGMPKNVYYRQSLLYQTLLVKWNIRSLETIKDRMDKIEAAIIAGETLSDMNPVIVDSIRTILELLDKIYGSKRNCM